MVLMIRVKQAGMAELAQHLPSVARRDDRFAECPVAGASVLTFFCWSASKRYDHDRRVGRQLPALDQSMPVTRSGSSMRRNSSGQEVDSNVHFWLRNRMWTLWRCLRIPSDGR